MHYEPEYVFPLQKLNTKELIVYTNEFAPL